MDLKISDKLSEEDKATAKEIVLGGKKYVIPILAPRQNKRIVSRLNKLSKFAPKKGATERVLPNEEDMDDVYQCCFWALTRAYPEVNEKDFYDAPITISEGFRALPIIAQQTGMMGLATEDDTGEAAEASPSTGTASLPE